VKIVKLVYTVHTLHVKTKEFVPKSQIFRITTVHVSFHSPEKVAKSRSQTHAKFTTRYLVKTTEPVSSKPITPISLVNATCKTRWDFSSTPANPAKHFYFVPNFLVRTAETALRPQIFQISLAIVV
jgi:hypothetical protein